MFQDTSDSAGSSAAGSTLTNVATGGATFAHDLNQRYGALPAQALLETMLRHVFPRRIALVSSFGTESAVLLHLISEIDRATPILFLDTGKLFEQTLRYRDELADRLGLTDIRVLRP